MVQTIAKYKISSMKLIKLKAGFGSRISQIQDSYKVNQQNQDMPEMVIPKINSLTTIQMLTKMQMVI